MDELACLMDWDLEAIVRGCSGEASAASTIINLDNFSHFFSEQDEILCSFPEFSETTKVFDELEELYKPFYPVLHPLSTQTIVTTSSLSIPKEPQDSKVVLKASEKVTIHDLLVPTVSKCKTSKSKNKKKNKVVKQVTASDSVCDAWAWRKYGQKPIKGSPYPRSYYRCSSSKGCLARKQVERSHLDPSVFLVTYTAEHNHPYPTRRSSLAGSTRKNNFIVAPPPSTRDQNTSSSSSSSSSSSAVVQSIEDEVVVMKSVQQSKGLKKEEDFFELLDEVELGDGWFSSIELEELIGLDRQLALDSCMLLDHN